MDKKHGEHYYNKFWKDHYSQKRTMLHCYAIELQVPNTEQCQGISSRVS